MATIKKMALTPKWEAEIKKALQGKFIETTDGIAFDLSDAKGATTTGTPNSGASFSHYYFLVSAPEITKPSIAWLPTHQQGDVSFFYTDKANPEGFWVEFEIEADPFIDVCEITNILQVDDTVDSVFEAGIYPKKEQDFVVAYAMKYGISEQVAQARASHNADKEPKNFKPEMEALLSEAFAVAA